MPTVLIVDDSGDDRERVSGMLADWQDCTILETDNGKTALEQIKSHLPDLILTALNLPEMDGIQLVAAVKEDYPNIPVILMTAEGDEDAATKALKIGAVSYVPKFRLPQDLLPTLDQVHKIAILAHAQSPLMHYMTDAVTNFVLPNDIGVIEACVGKVISMLRCIPLGDEAERVRVAISFHEALNNACFHGNLEVATEQEADRSQFAEVAAARCWEEPYLERRIHVRASISRQRVEFVIRDEGDGFDIATIGGDGEGANETGSTGRGIRLIKSTMNEVSYNDKGNEVTMIRNAVGVPEAG